MKLLAVALVLPATILFGIVAFETQLFFPPPSNAPTKGIVWDGHTFASRGDFARWLRSQGVSYAVWARRHPALAGAEAAGGAHPPAQRAAGAKRAGQKGSDWIVETVGGGLAALAGLGLAAVFLRRRRAGSGGRAALGPAARRAAPVARGGARPMLRLAKAAARLSVSIAKFSGRLMRRRGTEFARFSAHRAAPAAKRGARLMLRWAKAAALLALRTARFSARIIRRRGTELAGSVAHRAGPAAKGGARLTLHGLTTTALLSSSLAASSAHTIRRRRSELAWYLASGLLAAGIGVVATVWLSRV
jgi:hypothetical protein